MNDIRAINVGGHQVGLRGLDAVLDELSAAAPDLEPEAAGRRLLESLGRTNYIPDAARPAYEAALGREYARRLGRPAAAPEPPAGLAVEVLGQGCASCEDLTRRVYQALERLGIAASVTHVRDDLEIASRRVRGLPALVVAGRVVVQGAPPTDGELERWLSEAEAELKAGGPDSAGA